MSSHSGTIGRKRGGSGGGSGGGSEYYFGVGGPGVGGAAGGEQLMRRQRSAEWHSRHGYSSSEDEYQNTTGQAAFDTQLLATLLLQSQQLANMDRYNSDADTEEATTSLLSEYPNSHRDQNNAALYYPQKIRQQQQNLIPPLCSPHKAPKQSSTTFSASVNNVAGSAATTTATPRNSGDNNNSSNNSASSKYLANSNGASVPTIARSTNPFLSSKFDSPQSNSDSLSERLTYSGSSVVLDHLQVGVIGASTNGAIDFGVASNRDSYLLPAVGGSSATGVSASTTASSLQNPVGRESSLRTSRSKSARLGRSSGMTSSSSATSSNSAAAAPDSVSSVCSAAVASAMAAALASRNEREKLKLQQIQMELREFAQGDNVPSGAALASAAKFADDLVASGTESEPPPEPAPPEIPPRTQSLLMSLRKSTDFKLKYEEKDGDQKHEEFIPASQLQHLQQQQQEQLKRDYSVVENSRSCDSQSKSMASGDSSSQTG